MQVRFEGGKVVVSGNSGEGARWSKHANRRCHLAFPFPDRREIEAVGNLLPHNIGAREKIGAPLPSFLLHDRDTLVTACGRICMHRKRINISSALAGQRLGIKEADAGIWRVSPACAGNT